MIVDRLDLDVAVAEGIVSRDQALRLRDLAARDRLSRDGADSEPAIDFTQDTRDEPFRLLRGFRDVFIAIGVAIFSIGITLLLARGGWHPVAALFLCVIGVAQAEIITRRQRLPLSSLVVALAVGVWAAGLFGSVANYILYSVPFYELTRGWSPGEYGRWATPMGAIIGLALFYWRYRLPFALLPLAGALVGLSIIVVTYMLGPAWLDDHGRLLIGLWGLAIFGVAMWFDMKDRLRVTRLSECAFWLHLFAAPMLVHALLFDENWKTASPSVVLPTMAVLAGIALLIDRRALFVAGLIYFAFAIARLASDSVLGDQTFAITAFVLGAIVLALGLGWTPARRRVLAILPFEGLKSRLPPAVA